MRLRIEYNEPQLQRCNKYQETDKLTDFGCNKRSSLKQVTVYGYQTSNVHNAGARTLTKYSLFNPSLVPLKLIMFSLLALVQSER